MGIKFTSVELRDALANRLADLAMHMMRSMDQGNDGRIAVDDEMAADVEVAACVVATCEITEDGAS